MNARKNLDTRFATVRKARVAAPPAAGFKLLEMMIVVALCCIMTAAAVPTYQSTMHSMHLSSAATSLSSAIQAARYYAISRGCSAQIAVSAQSYHVTALALTGTPPQCDPTFTYAELPTGVPLYGAQPFAASNGDVSLTPSTTVTLQLNPNGTVTTPYTLIPTAPQSFNLTIGLTNSAGAATKQVNISGMGYVKII